MRIGLAFRLALRGLKGDRVTSVAAIGILALGLAAPTTFFSILWGGGLRPLPVPDGDRVVRVDIRQPSRGGAAIALEPGDLEALQEAGSLSGLGAFSERSVTVSTPGVGATRVSLADMTAEVFTLLRVGPLMGRVPSAVEAETGFVMGYDLWTEAFESDPDILGTAITVSGEPRTVSAVMPEGFQFPFKHSAWIVLPTAKAVGTLEVVGRLADDATNAVATVQLDGIWRRRDVVRKSEVSGGVVSARPFTAGRGEGGEAIAFGGLVLVGLSLLLIACVNAANLLLVRAADRIRGLGVQAALGATRLQISGQLLMEAFLLAAAGGVLGLGLASIMTDYVQTTMGARNFGYYWMRVAIDGPVLIFTGALVLGTAVVAGMVPVVRVWKTDVQQVLKGGRASSTFEGFGGWGRYLVVGQLALSCGALVAAGLTGQAMRVASTFGDGLPSREVLVGSIALDGADYQTVEARAAAIEGLVRAANGVPGARSAAVASGAPGYFEPWTRMEAQGVVYDRPEDRPLTAVDAVTQGFFEAMDLAVMQGRGFTDADRFGAAPVALVSESLARRLSGAVAGDSGEDRNGGELGRVGDVLGMAVRVPLLGSEWATVVGIVDDAELGGGPRARGDALYLSAYQIDMKAAMILLRTVGEPTDAAGDLRRAVASVDPQLAVSGLTSLADGHRFITQAQSTLSSLAVTGGLAGLLVAAVGLFGLLSFRVRQRMRELGVRMALGADGQKLGRELIVFSLRQLVPAIVVGLAGAWIVAPALGPLLLGGDPRSGMTYVAVATLFLATGILATLVPALRAATADPMEALRSE
jgi:putative ABC transport system permease protein